MLKVDKVFSPLGQTNYQGVRLPQIQNLVTIPKCFCFGSTSTKIGTIPKCCLRNKYQYWSFFKDNFKKFSFGLANSKAFPTVRLVYFQDQYQSLAISVNINFWSLFQDQFQRCDNPKKYQSWFSFNTSSQDVTIKRQ